MRFLVLCKLDHKPQFTALAVQVRKWSINPKPTAYSKRPSFSFVALLCSFVPCFAILQSRGSSFCRCAISWYSAFLVSESLSAHHPTARQMEWRQECFSTIHCAFSAEPVLSGNEFPSAFHSSEIFFPMSPIVPPAPITSWRPSGSLLEVRFKGKASPPCGATCAAQDMHYSRASVIVCAWVSIIAGFYPGFPAS